MKWKDYENAVFEILRSRFPAEKIGVDSMLPGRFSKINRQIDVAGHTSLMGHSMLAIVDCKCYSRRVDVKDVEAIIGMAADVNAHVALIVTTIGCTKAAQSRAEHEPNAKIHLDIVSISDANELAIIPAVAFMYRGRIGATVLAPSGWVATSCLTDDGKRIFPGEALCNLHPSNLSVREAFSEKRIGWSSINDNPDHQPGQLEKLLEFQNNRALAFDSTSQIETWHEPIKSGASQGLFRRIRYEAKGYVDFTFFLDLANTGIFWSSMVCPFGEEETTLSRLRFVADSVILGYAPEADPSASDEIWQDFFPWRRGI